MSDLICVSIDDRPVEVPTGASILEAAKAAGVEIPTLCYHKDLLPDGSCRFCTVEVQTVGGKKLVTACTERVLPGMRIATHSPQVVETRRFLLSLLLEKHKKSCFSCEKAEDCIHRRRPFCNYDNSCYTCPKVEECKLRAYCIEYGVTSGACGDLRKEEPVNDQSQVFLHDPNRCILCRRCVRACREARGDGRMIAVDGRGSDARIILCLRPEANCGECMKCVEVCPTGALVRKEESKE